MKANFTIKSMPETNFGCNILDSLDSDISKIGGSKVLLIVDKNMKENKLTEPVEQLLSKSYPEFQTILIEEAILSVDQVSTFISQLQPDTFDIIVSYGGWRCIDLGKIIGVWATNNRAFNAGSFDPNFVKYPGIPLISIPTTPPNGAEIDTKVLLRNKQEKSLESMEHAYLCSRLTLIDPDLMTTLPGDITVATGIDAIGHAVDALVSINSSPFSEILALQSLALILENIQKAYTEGNNIRARYNVAFGSMLSALALNMTGSGLIHALAYPLIARNGISHAQASALMSLHAFEFYAPVVPSYFLKISQILRQNNQDETTDIDAALKTIKNLFRNLDQPSNLSSYNIQGIDLNELANLALKYDDCLSRNPREIDQETILQIYRRAY